MNIVCKKALTVHTPMYRSLNGLAADEVKRCLEKENEVYKNMPGQNSEGVSAHPIRLTIAGRDLPTLTVVDLPGIVTGNQQQNMSFAVRMQVALHFTWNVCCTSCFAHRYRYVVSYTVAAYLPSCSSLGIRIPWLVWCLRQALLHSMPFHLVIWYLCSLTCMSLSSTN